MCEVLAFPVAEAAARRRPMLAGAQCRVVIFPGVRIERREFTPAEARRLSHLPPARRTRRHPLAKAKD